MDFLPASDAAASAAVNGDAPPPPPNAPIALPQDAFSLGGFDDSPFGDAFAMQPTVVAADAEAPFPDFGSRPPPPP
eukprot:6175864-Pleurochrysis_carterae.AAC.2